MKIANTEYRKSIIFLFQWLIISITAGITGSLIVAFFSYMVTKFSTLPDFILYLLFMIVLATASVMSIGSGISVGLTSPSILIGLILGAASAALFGFQPGEPAYFFLLSAGFAGLLSSTINVPIGAAVIAIESFGASYGFCAGISSIIGFQVNRHHTLYDYTVSYTD